ncbi:MAG: type 1 glutamine amidotransferase [Deltaproteobacteria bacterium]|nr:type 1 glutamine amidotransferase [Deltaproteobacteria bacterium]
MLTLIQNDQEVPAGNLLGWLGEFQIPFRIVRPYSGEVFPSITDISALVVLGGAMGVHDCSRYPYLLAVKSYLQQVICRDVPLLGICLGGQLLADVLGAPVHSQRNGERGLHSVEKLKRADTDPLFLGIPQAFTTFQWHNDSFEIPAGAVCLASSPVCAHQAFRYGANHYGLQFHPEVTRSIVSSWIESFAGGNNSTRIMEDFIREEKAYAAISRKLLENFLQIARVLR